MRGVLIDEPTILVPEMKIPLKYSLVKFDTYNPAPMMEKNMDMATPTYAQKNGLMQLNMLDQVFSVSQNVG